MNDPGPSRRSNPSTPPRIQSPKPRPQTPESTFSTPNRPTTPHLDLASFPTTTLLRLLASLLQQIATANDLLRPEPEDDESNSSRSGSRQSSYPSPTTALFTDSPTAELNSVRPTTERTVSLSAPASSQRMFTASMASLSHPSSLLSFHARHIPSISIEAYLLRILKYCPTTNEVFLGLLVYFDRMSKLGTAGGVGGTSTVVGTGGRGFAIDSYNVHRLVIAGVTVASKFFSDVFYTNSRYAKVGGLPPHELNQLELQFLLLNDFRLRIPLDEMQRYGDRLLGYWETQEEDRGRGMVKESVLVTNPSVSETMDVVNPEPSGQETGEAETNRNGDHHSPMRES